MIFIDSNIPMYLVGAAHPNKDAARRVLELAINRGERLVTSAEVMQEILHRYAALRRLDANVGNDKGRFHGCLPLRTGVSIPVCG